MIHKWTEVVQPHVEKFRLAAKFGGSVVYNAEGCKAMAEILTRMASTLDELNTLITSTHTKKERDNDEQS